MAQKRRILVAFEDSDDVSGSSAKRQKKIVVSKMAPLQV